MKAKAKIIGGRVHLILSQKDSKILGEMEDYSRAISEDIASGLGDSGFFSSVIVIFATSPHIYQYNMLM